MKKDFKYFKESEFECKCGCGELPNIGIMAVINLIRHIINEPLIITSGKRCKKHNREIGGSKHSQHVLGNACDIQYLRDNTPERIKQLRELLYELFPNSLGIGEYDNFVHIDIRNNKARWRG